jgi:DNA-binding CsgD family transcriptional regulator
MREGSSARFVSPELVGRDDELSAIGRLVGLVGAGPGATLLLAGEAGVGKSALLDRAVQIARRSGLAILRAECIRFEMSRAFGPFVDALRPHEGHPAVAPTFAVADRIQARLDSFGGLERYRAHAAFIRALTELSDERPLFVALDDIHWADESSLELFAHLSRRLPRSILLVGTYRPDEVERRTALRHALADVSRERTTRLRLRTLSTSEVGRTLRLILGKDANLASETREILQARSAGNPLFLEEILRALAQRGDLRHVDGQWHLGRTKDVPLPDSVESAVQEQLANLDPAALGVVRCAAVVGERFDVDVVSLASRTAPREVIGAMRQAANAGLVVDTDARGVLAFRHALVRDGILEDVLQSERRGLHRRIAETLAERDSVDPTITAYHWDSAGERDRAFDHRVRAGEYEARRFAHAEALTQWERALELAPDDDRTVAELSQRCADMAQVLGRSRRVTTHAEEASRRWERLGEGRQLSRSLLTIEGASIFTNPTSDARRDELVDQVIAILEPLGDSAELAWAYALRAVRLTRDGDSKRAFDYARRGVEVAERSTADWVLAVAYRRLSMVQLSSGDIAAAVTSLRRAVAASDSDRTIDPRNNAPAGMTYLVSLANVLEQTSGETDEVRALRERARAIRDSYALESYHIRMHRLLLTAAWDELVELHDAHTMDRDEAEWTITHHGLHRAYVEAARVGPGALPRARSLVEDMLRSGDTETTAVTFPEIALVLGQPRTALDALEGAARFVTHPDVSGQFMTYAGIYALIAANEEHDRDAVRRWLERFPQERSPLLENFRIIAHAMRFGRLERMWFDGERDAAIDALASLVDERQRQSLDIWPLTTYFLALREVEMRAERRAAPDIERATALLAWVVDFYRKGKAVWYLERLRERAERWRIPFPAAEEKPALSVILTKREREVALLVASGLTNREIAQRLTLSVRTAENHVERIRSKLGLRTRAQLAVWATQTYGPVSSTT